MIAEMIAAPIVFAAVVASGAEGVTADPTALPGQLKSLGTDYGLLGLLLSISLGVIGTLFVLLMRERGKRDVALAAQALEHARLTKESDDAHARDRAEWHASTTLLQEARVGQLREVLSGLTGATEMIRSTQAIIAERTQTSAEQNARMAEMAQGLAALRSAIETESASTRRALVGLGEDMAAAVKRAAG